MKGPAFILIAIAATALFADNALRGQNPLPNSPPSLAPRTNSFGHPADASPARAPESTAPATVSGATGNPVAAPITASVSNDYVLSAADTVEMSVFNEPGLTTQTRISADGKVQFPLIGEVKIGGLALRDARELIRKRYDADYLVDPQVYLNIMAYAARRVTVLGQVNRPGTYDIPGGESLGLLEAIGLAGGFTRLANEGSVEIKRQENGKEKSFKVNAKKLTTREGSRFELQPGDIVNVGESWF